MKVVLCTTHLAPVGGAENYLMRLAMALEKISDFYVVQNWPKEFPKFNGFGKEFRVYSGLFKPDVFIYCSHFRSFPPIGVRNFVVSLFPKHEVSHVGFERAIAICDYASTWTKRIWNMESDILYPAIDPLLFVSSKEKQKKIVSIGHFFEESDGHSKNQHILASAFTGLPGYELVLTGNASSSDSAYIRKVRKSAEGKNIRVEVNKEYEFIKAELSTASHLWHANGYGRTDPAQTEHFGIIVLEALASGVVPIVHNSGGAPEIAGITWSEPAELPDLTLRHRSVPKFHEQYTITFFERKVGEWLSKFQLTKTT